MNMLKEDSSLFLVLRPPIHEGEFLVGVAGPGFFRILVSNADLPEILFGCQADYPGEPLYSICHRHQDGSIRTQVNIHAPGGELLRSATHLAVGCSPTFRRCDMLAHLHHTGTCRFLVNCLAGWGTVGAGGWVLLCSCCGLRGDSSGVLEPRIRRGGGRQSSHLQDPPGMAPSGGQSPAR